jgi:hypothetical protein
VVAIKRAKKVSSNTLHDDCHFFWLAYCWLLWKHHVGTLCELANWIQQWSWTSGQNWSSESGEVAWLCW